MIKKFLRRMVGLLSLTGMLVLAGSAVMPINAEAAEHSGTFGENDALSWNYDESTKTVTITGEDEVKEIYNTSDYKYKAQFPEWQQMDIEINKIEFQNCKIKGSMSYAFSDSSNSFLEIDLLGLDTSQVTDMECMFSGCSRLTSLDFRNFDTSKVTSMKGMFTNCSNLTTLDLSSFDTSQVTDMSYLFYCCSKLNSLDISSFDTSKVTNMWDMFLSCSNLTSLDLKHFNTSQVRDMGAMFAGCSRLTSLDLSSFDTSKVVSMHRIFSSCSDLTAITLSNFDTSQVTDMESMFDNCRNLTSLDLSSFDISKVTRLENMFRNCNNLKSIKTPQILKEGQFVTLPSVYYDTVAYENGEYTETEVVNTSYAGKFLKRVSDLNNDTNNNTGTDNNTNNETTIIPSDANGWYTIDGKDYWYENGIRQGTEGRGKEIYDPDSDAWYWLDSIDGGKKAVSKDLYQESLAGDWAEDKESGTGKWVRYDENGHMIKGWNTNKNGTYYFDLTYGTMAKGEAIINGVTYYFNQNTGILESSTGGISGTANGWQVIDGIEYWYENGVRQGTEGRGKEIYDPDSDAWYWLDSVDNGKKAVSKDVYQESQADNAGNIGKWVRYDENGHMIKGWNTNENGTYYFDLTYGTMVKGEREIDGKIYFFNEETGILLEETKVSSVSLEHFYEESMEYAIINALDDNGKVVWTYQTEKYPAAQLNHMEEIGIYDDRYYFIESGTVIACNLSDGSIIWKNDDFGGSGGGDFGDDGTIYLCGYFGPDFFAVDAQGNTLIEIDTFDSNYFGAYKVEYLGDTVRVLMESGAEDYDKIAEVTINLEDYSYDIQEILSE